MSNTQNIFQYNKEFVIDIFEKKEEFHRAQSELPIEEKLRIMIELQKIELTIRPRLNQNDRRCIWQL